jgi:simple sugar transport system ATP-binding protein
MNAIEMRGITKRFGPLVANDRVDLQLAQGEIRALLGENGAGKTTLMRILYGLYNADEGEIWVNGNKVSIASPHDAIQNRIGMVTQHFTLVPTLTVSENIVLGYKKESVLSPKEIDREVAAAAERFGIEVKPSALIRNLSVGERQRVEILKTLYREARVLILDEPTAVLVPQEVDVLFETLRRLQKDGMSIIFITHKLNEVMDICDSISVLRDGQMIGTVEKKDTTQKDLACMMVGRETFGVTRDAQVSQGKTILKVDNLSLVKSKEKPTLSQINLEVHSGEILGLAGVSGNGQAELVEILTGLLKPSTGKITIEDHDLTGCTPSQFTHACVGRIPEDRHVGVVGELSIADNLALENLENFTHNGILDQKAILKNAEKLISEYQIKGAPTDLCRTLSGGNMQKVILARAISSDPHLVIAAQPTRGLDVGATDYVRTRLLEQREKGAAVLLISEDLEEILALSDNIAVIYEGEIVGTLPANAATAEQLGLMMSGAWKVQNG